jgi:DNA-binding NarL/FixJ family response regulator
MSHPVHAGQRSPRRPALSQLAVVDSVMSDLARPELGVWLRLEAETGSDTEPQSDDGAAVENSLGRLESAVGDETHDGHALQALLAYRRVELGADAARATELAERALDGGQLLSRGIRSPAPFAAGIALGAAGHTRAASDLFSDVGERALKTRSFAVFSAARAQRGIQRYHEGRLGTAFMDLQSALDIAEGQPWETMIDDGRAHLLRIYIERGQLDLAQELLGAWSATGLLPDTTFGNGLLIERARLRLAEGRFAQAIGDLDLVASRLGEWRNSPLFEWRVPATLAHHHLGHRDVALWLANAQLEAAQAWGAPRQRGVALATLGVIQKGADGIQALRDAIPILTRASARLELARALINLGAALRREGSPSVARAELRSGRTLAEACGALALVALADQELAATGIKRRRREMLSGVAALTASERRVAELAAHGLSNPEIASSLFVTRKTVEMHLGNVYRKLCIHSRDALAAALTASQEHPVTDGAGHARLNRCATAG